MTIDELVDEDDSAWPEVESWVREGANDARILPVDAESAAESLEDLQTPTSATMGAVVYYSGGMLFDHGWLRLLGSGSDRLTRTLPGWNLEVAPPGRTSLEGRYLVADDAIGGFFAVNGGWFDSDLGTVHYFAPDTLEWESMQRGYTEFVHWCCTGDLETFYEAFRWEGWERDVAELPGDMTFTFTPPLFTRVAGSPLPARRVIPVLEAWQLYFDEE